MNGFRERGASIGLDRKATQNEAAKAPARPKLVTSLFGGRCIDICLRFRYILNNLAHEGRIPDAIRNVERVRCFRAGSQPAPERLRASFPSVLRPRRGVLPLHWDAIERVTPA